MHGIMPFLVIGKCGCCVFHTGRYCTIIGCSGLLSTGSCMCQAGGVYLVCCSLARVRLAKGNWYPCHHLDSRDGCFCTIYSYSRAQHLYIYIHLRMYNANFVSFSISVCILCVRMFQGTLTDTNIKFRFSIQALWFTVL